MQQFSLIVLMGCVRRTVLFGGASEHYEDMFILAILVKVSVMTPIREEEK